MYEAFFHLSTNPFRLTPDPEFCFSHTGYQSAREYLDYALRLGEGFIMVTGRPGTGKTTLAESFLGDLDLNEVAARRIAASSLEANDLLRAVAYAYGIEAENLDKATLRRRIEQYFTRQEQCRRRSLLIIDEAQGVPHSSLEELRLLADMQSGSRPLLQLFLIGQEKLRDLMHTPEMDQFQQRIIATCHLTSLDLQETRAYIEHRLRQAGWKGDPELTGAAVLALHQCSGGVPRHINKVCNRLLLLGYGKGKHLLDREEVQVVAGELRREQLTPLGGARETPAQIGASRPGTEFADGSLSLSELAIRMEPGAAKDPVVPVTRPPETRPAPHAATQHARQAAAWRLDAAVTARRKQRAMNKPPAPEKFGVAGLLRACHRYHLALMRRLIRRARWKEEMALGVAALVVATLSMAGLARLSGDERIDPERLSGEPVLSEKSSLLANDQRRDKAGISSPRSGDPGPLLQAPAGIQPASSGPSPADSHRVVAGMIPPAPATVGESTGAGTVTTPGSTGPGITTTAADTGSHVAISRLGAAVMVAQTPDETSERNHLIMSSRDAAAVTSPLPATVPVQDGAEIPRVQAGQDGVAMTVATAVLPDFARMEPPAAGGAADRMAQPEKSPEPTSVSREVRIAGQLAMGQRSLMNYRLLTPKGNNAYEYYMEVLVLDPGNIAALDGLDRIAERYITLVERANERQDTTLARVYISRGLSVQPDNRELLALQDRMREPQQASRQVAVIQASPDVQVRPQQDDFLTLLKSLFGGERRDKAEVVDRSVPSSLTP